MNIQDETAAFMESTDGPPTHPRCPQCRVPMWLIVVERHGDTERKQFECKACGAKTLS
jgi:hypothetical protein